MNLADVAVRDVADNARVRGQVVTVATIHRSYIKAWLVKTLQCRHTHYNTPMLHINLQPKCEAYTVT